MMRAQKGYSMIVLVIAITVILILVSSAVSVLQVSREKTNITNFIFDISTVQEEVQNFYTSTGTLPVKTFDKIDIIELDRTKSDGILSQLYAYDNENYYYIDLSQIGTIALKDSERQYIVNEGSLKVYVVNGTEYSNLDDEENKVTYYTLTSNLIDGLEQYIQQDEEMLVIGNPITWTNKAELRLILPRRSLESNGSDSWENWTFKWDFGPKTAAELASISESDTARNFEYGDILTVKSNGIYSIYARDPENNETVLNVNVTKIDDINPTYEFIINQVPTLIQAVDNETGIKAIRYKTLQNYKDNEANAAEDPDENLVGRTAVDYYLVGGLGKDLIYDLPMEISLYKAEKATIQNAIDAENKKYDDWATEDNMKLLAPEEIELENTNHQNLILDLNNQLSALNAKYPYLSDIYGTTEQSRLVIYIEDYAGNATVVGTEDVLTTEMLAISYNISIEGL